MCALSPSPNPQTLGPAHMTRGFGGASLAPPPENATGEFYKDDKCLKMIWIGLCVDILSQNDTEYPFSLKGGGGIYLIELKTF